MRCSVFRFDMTLDRTNRLTFSKELVKQVTYFPLVRAGVGGTTPFLHQLTGYENSYLLVAILTTDADLECLR